MVQYLKHFMRGMKKAEYLPILLLFFAASLCYPEAVHAHRLNVFAWQNDHNVIVESNFGENRPARNADVKVTVPDSGEIILTGKTDKKGIFSFPVPAAHIVDITVSAGQGHQNVWRLESSAPTLPTSQPMRDTLEKRRTEARDLTVTVSTPELRNIIREELQTMTALQSLNQMPKPKTEPGFTEIVGGIGWIIGIAGIFFWFRAYRKKPE